MAYGDLNESNKRLMRLGAIGALCVVIAGGVFVLFDRVNDLAPAKPVNATMDSASGTTAHPPSKTSDDPVVPTDAQSDQVRGCIADARRQAATGNFTEAEALLRKADKVIPDLPETAQARSDFAAMATPQGQLATQLARARAAIDQNDGAAAEKALAEAERLNPQAPEIVELRRTLQAAQQKQTRHNDRITALLTTMREAIARHDLAAADSALNEAERIDIQDSSVRRARVELGRAQNADQKAGTHN